MRRTSAFLAACIFAVGAGWSAPTALAGEDSDETSAQEGAEQDGASASFEELSRRGARAFQQKEYQAAQKAFERAYELRPVPNLLYNIGRALEKQGDFEGAIEYYQKFVNEPEVEMAARRDALERLKTLREVVELREEGRDVDPEEVESEEEAAEREEAELAETDVGTTDDESAGDESAGDESAGDESAGDESAGDESRQTERASPAESDRGERGETSGAELDGSPVDKNYAPAYISGGMAAASFVAAGVVGALTAQTHGDFEDASSLSDRRSVAETGRTQAVVADGLLAGGVVLSAVGLYFWLSPPTTENDARQEASGARLVPSAREEGASLDLFFEFW